MHLLRFSTRPGCGAPNVTFQEHFAECFQRGRLRDICFLRLQTCVQSLTGGKRNHLYSQTIYKKPLEIKALSRDDYRSAEPISSYLKIGL